MSRIFLLGIFVFHSLPDFSQNFIQEKLFVYFDKDKDILDANQLTILRNHLALNKDKYIYSISMEGHTDKDGSHPYNDNLSARRTQTIQRLLGEYALHTEVIVSNHYGEHKPTNAEKNEEQKSKNRRVELTFKYINAKDINDIVSTIQPDFNQEFNYDPKLQKIEVKGKKGTYIEIDRNQLLYADGTPLGEKDQVKVKLNEIQTFLDQLQANISTETHDGKILESGGMFNLSVTANDKELKLKDGAEYKATLPNKFKTNNMSVFEGAKDSTGQVKWNLTETKFTTKRLNKIPRPSACINPDSFKKLKLEPRLQAYLVEREFNFNKPSSAAKPIYPREVRAPKIYTMNYFSFWDRLMISRKERLVVLDDLNGKQIEKYEKRVDKRELKLAAYDEYKKAYILKELEYKKLERAYQDSIASMFQYINNYSIALIEKQYLEEVRRKVRAMVKLSEKDSLFISNLNGFLFTDYMSLTKNVPNRYLTNLKRQFKSVLMEYYDIKDSKLAYQKFLGDWDPFRNQPMTLGDWHQTANMPLVNYLTAQSNELIYREIETGYREDRAVTDIFQASLTTFSWINCDRFYKTAPSMIATYKIKKLENKVVENIVQTVVIMPSINSCLGIYNNFIQIPKSEAATIISYYLDENKKIMLAKKNIKEVKDDLIHLDYNPVSISELTKELISL
jgi:hypothetical protein